MKTSYMKEFVAVADFASFTKAAEYCYTTQPSLSKHIVEVEIYFGVRLFERSHHKVELTTEGKVVYKHFKWILNQFSVLEYEIAETVYGLEGVIRVGVLYYSLTDYIYPIKRWFDEKFPKIKIKLFSYQHSQLMQALSYGDIDVGIIVYYQQEMDYTVHSFAKDRFMAMLSKKNPLSLKEKIGIQDLEGQSIILIQDLNDYNDYVKEILMKKGVEPKEYLYSSQIDTTFFDVEFSNGIILFPSQLRRQQHDNLVFRDIEDSNLLVDMAAVYKNGELNPIINTFLKQLDLIFR